MASSSSSYQVLEVTLISAKDLKRVTLFSKMRVYAVASISGGDPRLPTHRTYADREGGRNPMWHAPLRFTIPRCAGDANLALHVLLRAERRAFGFGDRDVGEVVVPVRDLAAAASGTGGSEQRHLSYQVRRPVSGRKRGVLHISYRLTDVPAAAANAGPVPYDVRHHQYVHDAAKREQHKSGSAAVTAYPSHQHAHSGRQYVPPYSGSYPHHHQYGYGGAYGCGQGGVAAARHDGGAGMGAGLGLGVLSGAVSGMMIGDMVADAEAMDGVGC